MKDTMAFVGETQAPTLQSGELNVQAEIYRSIQAVSHWLEGHDYKGYDTFDGLNARFLRALTFESPVLRTVLLQGVRRFPINLRPLLGIAMERSTKGMGFLARSFMRLHDATGDGLWAERAEAALEWLIANQVGGYSGACWGNHFDYQSRTFYLAKNTPTVVWTSLIGHAFLDGFEHFGRDRYLDVAVSACNHIVNDLDAIKEDFGVCISYIPGRKSEVHNANLLGASLLARTCKHHPDSAFKRLAEQAALYTVSHQREDGSWYYGEPANLHWVDNFHTAYVLDCLKHYIEGTGDNTFAPNMLRGYAYWKDTFFLPDGAPRYYAQKTQPIDIQCSSQAIDTLVFFSAMDADALKLAERVALWTIQNMQDATGYFYYRRYGRGIVNKTPTLHWGQATMMSALAALYKALEDKARK
jgi:hypothetical protein